MAMTKRYSEIVQLKTFSERFEYAKLSGILGRRTFGSNRYLNQRLYVSPRWKQFRRDIILRDNCCDLAIEGNDIFVSPTIHHLNPISIEDVVDDALIIWDPENVICVSPNTHNAIHYGDKKTLVQLPTERRKGDTNLW